MKNVYDFYFVCDAQKQLSLKIYLSPIACFVVGFEISGNKRMDGV
jgi:hypothetical protein